MKKIAVVGMGQGGMVAAIKLAEAGFDVTVYEKSSQGQVSYEWSDDLTANVFELCDLPFPGEDVYFQKAKWIFVAPDTKGSLRVPQLKPLQEISVRRRPLNAYFVDLAAKAGCKFVYDTKIERLAVENEKVVGIYVNGEKVDYDLVIDASGMNSVIRPQVPDKFNIQKNVAPDGIMYGYRAFYKPVEGQQTWDPEIPHTLIFRHLGSEGISWCNLNEDGEVDVLIGRLRKITREDIDAALEDLRKVNPILSDQLIREQVVPICLRAGISNSVADGYVAIGDSAFQTIPVMGSGIETAMKVGAKFAKFVVDNKVEDFTAKNMWGFHVAYMKELGWVFSLLDIVRRWGLKTSTKRLNWVFGSGFLTYHNVAWIMLEKGYGKPHFNIFYALAKPFYLLTQPGLVFSLLGMVNKAVPTALQAHRIPKKYNEKKIAK
ncbi:MAG: FAD-binding protein, partial [Clostridia bacterium]|nr:FAD-binding protein [Clostridia bacterium]